MNDEKQKERLKADVNLVLQTSHFLMVRVKNKRLNMESPSAKLSYHFKHPPTEACPERSRMGQIVNE